MYIVKAKSPGDSYGPDIQGGDNLRWIEGQTRLVHEGVISFYRSNPIAWEIVDSDDSLVRASRTLTGGIDLLHPTTGAPMTQDDLGWVDVEPYVKDIPLMPLTGIDTVWLFGASLEVSIGSSWTTAMSKYMLDKYGLSITFVVKAWGGQWLHALQDKWELEKGAITGMANVMVVTMPYGNDVSNTRPWSGYTPTSKDDLIHRYNKFIDSIVANGNVACPVNLTFRNYDYNSVNDEEKGIKPFNEALSYKKSASLKPGMFHGGKPYIDVYDVTRNWYHLTFMAGDEIHQNNLGYYLLRTFYLENIAARIAGRAPVRIARVPDPVNAPQYRPLAGKTMLLYGFSATSPVWQLYGAFTRGKDNTVDQYTVAMDGFEVQNMRYDYTVQIPVTTACVDPVPEIGNTSLTLLNDYAKSKAAFVSSSTFVTLERFKGLNPDQKVSIEILSVVTAGTNPNMSGDVSTDGGATFLTINGRWVSGTPIRTYTIVGQADANGELTIVARKTSGSGGFYFNGMVISPLTA